MEKKKPEKFISPLPPPDTARIPAPAYVADNGLALAAVQDATAFYVHFKLARSSLINGCDLLLPCCRGLGLFQIGGD